MVSDADALIAASMQARAHGCRLYMRLELAGMRMSDAPKLMKAIGKAAPKDAHFHEDSGFGVVYTGGHGEETPRCADGCGYPVKTAGQVCGECAEAEDCAP
jgi:hypothetical protein